MCLIIQLFHPASTFKWKHVKPKKKIFMAPLNCYVLYMCFDVVIISFSGVMAGDSVWSLGESVSIF